jgi:hypothetical protein
MRVEIIVGDCKGSFFWAGSAVPERGVPDRTECIDALRSVGCYRERLAGEEGGLPRRSNAFFQASFIHWLLSKED